MVRGRRSTVIVLAALACTLIALLALPAFAAAETYVVDSIGDEANATPGTTCDTGATTGEECTLRAAIEAADANAGKDTIAFDELLFEGAAPEATITLGSPLPTVTEAVEIKALKEGGQCATGWFVTEVEGPCAEIAGLPSTSSGGSSLIVDAPNVTVDGLAFDGGANGIQVLKAGTGFAAADDWFGIGLDFGQGTAIAGAGIRLEPGAEGATIGGEAATARNVFGKDEAGLFIDGASSNEVVGNWFGLKPDGTFASNFSLKVGVRILDDTSEPTTAKAEDNVIGGELLKAEEETAACDGPCNVFATNHGADIEVGVGFFPAVGLATASGPTTIQGNYLGLSPDGTAEIGLSHSGVAGAVTGPAGEKGPGKLTVGGADAAAEGNFIDAAEYGVFTEGAEELSVSGNKFGYAHLEAPVEADGYTAMQIYSNGLREGALISGNEINASRRIGIEAYGAGSEITGNRIVEGNPGIVLAEDDEEVGNLIEANVLEDQERFGIEVRNSFNTLVGNTVIGADEIGIVLSEPAEHNRIGGDAPAEANTIEKTGFASHDGEGAIAINGIIESVNEVAGNTGSLNEGPFIALRRENLGEEGHPNQNIEPPVFATNHQSSATGTALPNATVRIFSKTATEEGELGALLTVVKVDGAGNWSASFPTQPVGALLTATQTSTLGGTSMLAAPVHATADPPPSTGGGSGTTTTAGNPTPISSPAPKAPNAPKVTITKGPKKSSTSTTATFKFKASVTGAKFECKLDKAKWASCRSPKTYKKLKPGKHAFQVRAVAGGLKSAVAKYKFTVKS